MLRQCAIVGPLCFLFSVLDVDVALRTHLNPEPLPPLFSVFCFGRLHGYANASEPRAPRGPPLCFLFPVLDVYVATRTHLHLSPGAGPLVGPLCFLFSVLDVYVACGPQWTV